MGKGRERKGAIEMSMQTIIVVVIGVTLLTLGLRFVYKTFTDIGGQQTKVRELTDKQISELFGESDESISVSPITTSIDQGDEGQVSVAVRNLASTKQNMGYQLEVTNAPEGANDVESWFLADTSQREVNSGAAFRDLVPVSVPNTAPLGTYKIKLTLQCSGGAECGDGDATNLVLRVQ
ncbi:hypothetical protein HY501_01855 [Candidatus Woesearchaeota archaeon]|nr:hypothetical protein [Candidatus Woesearchaeota archaeon]